MGDVDNQRSCRSRLNLDFDGALSRDTWIAPTLRRRIALATNDGDAEVIIGGNAIRLSAEARRALQAILEHDGLSCITLAETLGLSWGDNRLGETVAQLVAKGLCSVGSRFKNMDHLSE